MMKISSPFRRAPGSHADAPRSHQGPEAPARPARKNVFGAIRQAGAQLLSMSCATIGAQARHAIDPFKPKQRSYQRIELGPPKRWKCPEKLNSIRYVGKSNSVEPPQWYQLSTREPELIKHFLSRTVRAKRNGVCNLVRSRRACGLSALAGDDDATEWHASRVLNDAEATRDLDCMDDGQWF